MVTKTSKDEDATPLHPSAALAGLVAFRASGAQPLLLSSVVKDSRRDSGVREKVSKRRGHLLWACTSSRRSTHVLGIQLKENRSSMPCLEGTAMAGRLSDNVLIVIPSEGSLLSSSTSTLDICRNRLEQAIAWNSQVFQPNTARPCAEGNLPAFPS